jgi:hypothetical protein
MNEDKVSYGDKLLKDWASLKEKVFDLELDVTKAAAGNASAGARVRKALRVLAKDVKAMVKESVEDVKSKKETLE